MKEFNIRPQISPHLVTEVLRTNIIDESVTPHKVINIPYYACIIIIFILNKNYSVPRHKDMDMYLSDSPAII